MSHVQVLRLILEFSLLPRLSRGLVIDVPSLLYHFSRKAQVMILTPSLNLIRLLGVVINTPSVTSESTGR